MTERALGFDTNGTGDGTGTGYTEADVALWYQTFTQGANKGGVAPDRDNELAASGSATPVSIASGSAIVHGTIYVNTAAVAVTIPTPSTSTRIDRIVLRKGWTAQTVRITRIAGTEGGAAPAMTQTDGVTWDIPLFQVSITTGGVITLTDERGWLNLVGDGGITADKLAAGAVNARTGLSGTNGIIADTANGSARGADAVDLQTTRGNVAQVASGIGSVVGGGQSNKASGDFATVPGGFAGVANKYGQMAHAAGYILAEGDAQRCDYVPINQTTNSTPKELFLGGGGSTSRMVIPSDTTWLFVARIVARRIDADNESAAYKIEGCIDNNAGTTALVGVPVVTVLAEDTAAWDVAASADNANDALVLTVTGEAAKTINWVAHVQTVEVTG